MVPVALVTFVRICSVLLGKAFGRIIRFCHIIVWQEFIAFKICIECAWPLLCLKKQADFCVYLSEEQMTIMNCVILLKGSAVPTLWAYVELAILSPK